ncbi:hypothetical protein [Candidatus Bartonella washoeensis]|uniref:hypothetical protein n=1 Tax=Candidatus Bartonella washoeensis TaxID=186739 RepID=UPI0005541AD4|nr:hypothetical protein [Bartonella washoeensis]
MKTKIADGFAWNNIGRESNTIVEAGERWRRLHNGGCGRYFAKQVEGNLRQAVDLVNGIKTALITMKQNAKRECSE